MPFFDDIRLPMDIERNAVGGPRFKTTIFPADSGKEKRNEDWIDNRGEWDIAYGLAKFNELIIPVRNIFYTVKGRANGFRFRDWGDYTLPDAEEAATRQEIGLGDDVKTVFQIFKRYDSGNNNFYDRTIKKIVSGTLLVYLDAALQADPDDYSVDLNTGLITFVVAPASTGGSGPGGEELVEVSCEFDVPLRFNTDVLATDVLTFQAGSIPAIPLLELKDPDA